MKHLILKHLIDSSTSRSFKWNGWIGSGNVALFFFFILFFGRRKCWCLCGNKFPGSHFVACMLDIISATWYCVDLEECSAYFSVRWCRRWKLNPGCLCCYSCKIWFQTNWTNAPQLYNYTLFKVIFFQSLAWPKHLQKKKKNGEF